MIAALNGKLDIIRELLAADASKAWLWGNLRGFVEFAGTLRRLLPPKKF